MIRSVKIKNFTAVPHLAGSALMKSHKSGITFATDKPNVIVGANGAGKSALLKTLALETLSFYSGTSAFDNNYVSGCHSDGYWTQANSSWSRDYDYLAGLVCDTDLAPAYFYRPGFLPGDDNSIAASMMCGYFNEAKAHGALVDKKSSGQQSAALLAGIQDMLAGKSKTTSLKYQFINWKFRREVVAAGRNDMSFEVKAQFLLARYSGVKPGAKPLILLDEPEQSLDAKAEALLWRAISKADCGKMQVIAATHSLFPLMHPEKFNLIEATPGYINEVMGLI